jgi:Uma2 family endonuclease
MGHPALKQPPPRMTVDDFLAWDDGTDARYELIGGEVFLMAPPLVAHGMIVMNLGSAVRMRLKPPCRIIAEAGVRLPERNDTYYQADLAVTCLSATPGERNLPDPLIILEVLSPSTSAHDRVTKLPDYRKIPSVQEIVLLSTTATKAELWRRAGNDWTVSDVEGIDAVLHFASIDVEIPLTAIYEGVVFETEKTG